MLTIFPSLSDPLNKKYSLKSVKIGAIGAAPLDKQPQARLQKLIGEDVPLTQVWGMTETSCIATRYVTFICDFLRS